MSPRKLLVLTAVVLVLFGFIFFFERKLPSTAERQEKKATIWEIPQERIDSIRLERGGSVVELKKGADSQWRIVKPEPYPADSGAVADLTAQLSSLRQADGETTEARPEDYGLHTPSAKATVFWTAQDNPKKALSRTLELGIDIPGTDATAARDAGKDRVVFVPSSVATAIKKSPDDFKSKDVFGTSTADAARLEVERGRGRLSLTKKGDTWWLSQPMSDLADADAAQRLVGDLGALKVLEFLAGGQNLTSLGLSPPLFRVTVADSKGASTTVEFGSTRSDGNSIYARREAQVFTVGNSIADELSKEAEAFRETHLTHVDRARATAVSGVFAEGSDALERRGDGWVSGGKPVSASAVDDLFSVIGDLKSRAFVTDAEAVGAKGRQPEATVTVKSPDEEWTIRLFPTRDEARATVSGRPGGFALASDPTASLLAAFQKATVALSPTPVPAPTAKKP